MLTLDATVGGASSNTYCNALEADVYHDSHVSGVLWFAHDPNAQAAALVHATRMLDDYVEWEGGKTTRTQALRWPRTGVSERDGLGGFYDALYGYVIDPNSIPVWLKNATAELARWLLQGDRTAEPDMLEFSQMSVGSLSLTKDSSAMGVKDVIPEAVRRMVCAYGSVVTASGVGTIRLERG